MGTNYYLMRDECPTCGHPKEKLHIGKSSGGWCFTLHVDSYNGINDLPDWEKLWSDPKDAIRDEYGEVVSPQLMRAIITERKGSGFGPDDMWYRRNHAEPGPNGLVRYKVGYFCLAHGAGTWDLVVGDFS